MPITLIAALDRNRAIGRDGAMPWHLPDDLKRFKASTLGKPVLMGRKTAVAIDHVLPGRDNLVLTRGNDAPFATQQVVNSLDAALAIAAGAELCVIGGGEVYELALPSATRMLLTLVDTEVVSADAFFPLFEANSWVETSRFSHNADALHAFPFTFVDYHRVESISAVPR